MSAVNVFYIITSIEKPSAPKSKRNVIFRAPICKRCAELLSAANVDKMDAVDITYEVEDAKE